MEILKCHFKGSDYLTTIYLIRHSETLDKDYLNYLDDIDEYEKNKKLPLSTNGEKKALEISKLKELSNIDVIYSSTFQRSISTAKYIAEKNNIILNITPNLNERKLGNALEKNFWLEQLYDENVKAEDGESRRDATYRISNMVNYVLNQYKDKRVVFVTHGAVIKFLLMNYCTLKKADVERKSVCLVFNKRIIINDKFNTPEIFKLEYKEGNIVNIELLRQ